MKGGGKGGGGGGGGVRGGRGYQRGVTFDVFQISENRLSESAKTASNHPTPPRKPVLAPKLPIGGSSGP